VFFFLSAFALNRREWQPALIFSVIALFLSANTALLYWHPILKDESGLNALYLKSPHVGFVFWVFAMILLFGASLESLIRQARST